ncbi:MULTISPECIES: toxin-antitoxin system HicB family antitoxin [Micromonospora]|uniref:toxin-antitoxin system HicB family antitoxin n=1 Tax=Micromonospora TaxID=1873 RepID=UPI0003EECA0C|nr:MULTISPECIES: toxin-antitoxin system HicB family antitoxin [Micromonospora]EWM66338.1 HicB family protein [Micromonospora sp. M42]MBP1780493.1 putative HicB family RNase H-like nuclease [Micromonospora sp. HB375]MCK1809117.1 type II toxin-antitoxin system HicB family antitoxin [Micromonospora sp. R42106]MCK1833727.1 type II toxin-antitoxin system HicB family antitoxin [Micromonospora sp. R42003]MCK1845702.1 type II toxin-antitoxin system HicB family antitoxin [Micromonospora sp. R42004]
MADPAREAIPARAGGAEPLSERRYSGKFNLRVGESLHRELAIHAAEEGMSLNQYLLRKLSAA